MLSTETNKQTNKCVGWWDRQGQYADVIYGWPLDCEMCYTTYGIELTRVTVVDEDGADAYESFVRPDNPILDYNTRYVKTSKNR